jgi:putative flippase GtrA
LQLILNYSLANIISSIATKIVVYICNKKFVFKTKNSGIKDTLRELTKFIFARGVALILDMAGMILLVEVTQLNPKISKVVMIILVIVVNYIFSKYFVFRTDIQMKRKEDRKQ